MTTPSRHELKPIAHPFWSSTCILTLAANLSVRDVKHDHQISSSMPPTANLRELVKFNATTRLGTQEKVNIYTDIFNRFLEAWALKDDRTCQRYLVAKTESSSNTDTKRLVAPSRVPVRTNC